MNWPDIQGWMDGEDLDWLYNMASQMKSVVEIGSWKGRSTYALCSGCKGPVYAVDHWNGSPSQLYSQHSEAQYRDIYQDFIENVGHFSNLKIMRMDSVEASKHFAPGSVDAVFIDGEHTYESVLSDLKAWYPIKNKLICGHDIYMESVVKAIKDFGIRYKVEEGHIWREQEGRQ